MAALTPARQLLVLLALTAALLFPSLGAQYVWDDAALILRNPNLLEPSLGWLLGGDLWAGIEETGAHFYRPLMLLSLLVDRALGLGPFGAQLHSLCWHLLSVGLLVTVLKRHVRPEAALLGGVLLALHPMQSAVVRFVAARNDPMALCFVLVAALALGWRGWRGGLLAAAASLAALLSKETALAGLVGVVVLSLPDRRRSLWVAGGVLAWAGLRAGAALETPRVITGMAAWVEAGSQAMACLVWTPTCSPMMAPSELAGPAWLGLLLLAPVGLALWRGGALGRAGVVWFLMAGALGLTGALIADGLGWRYADIPLAGLALVVASLGWPSDRRTLLAAAGLAALLALPLRQVLPTWSSDQSLWEQAYATQPGPPTACGLFKTYELSGQDEAAAALLPAALPRPHCCFNASRFHLDRGRPVQALELGALALDRGCAPSPELTAPMALSAALLSDWDQAERYLGMNAGDPYGYTPVVASAAALRRGDRSVLERYAVEPAPEGAPPLEEQVQWLLSRSPEGASEDPPERTPEDLHEGSTSAP